MIYITYSRFFDFSKNDITIGGAQTYLNDLACLFTRNGYEVQVCQDGLLDRRISFNGYIMAEYKVEKGTGFEGLAKRLKNVVNDEDILIFGTDLQIPQKTRFLKTISIQHGIFWDVPLEPSRSDLRALISKARNAYERVKRTNQVDLLVCVDYNFVNWLRTQVDKINNSIRVIPNYTKIAPDLRKNGDTIRIIFARRLYSYRGTRIFSEAALKLLQDYGDKIHITIAGTGEDEKWMKEKFIDYPNVTFTSYKSNESLEVHQDKHIAVVPSIGSEGTSLSLLEAMSSQCAVVASDVGGMTNILIDGFNGLITPSSDAESLYEAVKKLIDQPKLREKLSHHAYETVIEGFSYDNWSNKWIEVIEMVKNA